MAIIAMISENTPPPNDAETVYPPGTVPLISHQLQSEDNVLVLSPTPNDDLENPLNWPLWRKALNYGLLVAWTTSIFVALLVQSVLWPQITHDLHITYSDITQAQAANLVGLAMGCVMFIPFTKKYGRRPAYVLSTLVLTPVAWWVSRMSTAGENYATNLLFGLAGAINETAVQMSIQDLFFLHQRATANGIYFAAVCTGSYLIPIPAGVVAEKHGWRAAYQALAITFTILLILFIFAYEETKYVTKASEQSLNDLKPSLAQESVSPEDDQTNRSLLRRYRHRMRLVTPTDESLWKSVYTPLYTVSLPHVVFTALQFGSGVCWLVILSSMIGVIFSAPPYNFSSAGIGYMFVGSMVGTVFGSLYGGPLVDWYALRMSKRNNGLFEPEMRIALYHIPSAFLAGGLIMFGTTADRGMHWIFPQIGTAFFAFGFGAIGDMAFTLVIDACPGLVAECFVTVAFFRNAISIAGPFALARWREDMSVSNIFIIAGLISFAINLLWIPMVIWGKRMRKQITPRYHRLCQNSVRDGNLH